MPWTTPTLKDTRRMTRDYVLSQLGAKAMIPNSALRIMSDAMAGLTHLCLLYLDWMTKQLLPDTSETEWLDRHGTIWLTNADGSKGRKQATFARGDVLFTGVDGTMIPIGLLLSGANTATYQVVTEGVIGASGLGSAFAISLTPGSVGNLVDGEALDFVDSVANLTDAVCDGDMTGGVDTETDEQLRARVLFRIQQPPMGGDANDYVAWALAVPGVTRAWAVSEMGPGTVTVRFMMDDLRAAQGGFPTDADCAVVTAYIDTQRPVTTKDRWVLSPVPEYINFTIKSIITDDDTVRAGIEDSVIAMLREKAKPTHSVNGQQMPAETIYAAWVSEAIMNVVGTTSFTLIMDDHPMPYNGSLGTLGTILYER